MSDAVICSYFLQGACTFGDNCRKSHDPVLIEKTRGMYCANWLAGSCTWGERCIKKHEKPPVQSPCPYFQKGNCIWGDNCVYLHTNTVKAPVPKKDAICKHYAVNRCRFTAETCVFQHKGPVKDVPLQKPNVFQAAYLKSTKIEKPVPPTYAKAVKKGNKENMCSVEKKSSPKVDTDTKQVPSRKPSQKKVRSVCKAYVQKKCENAPDVCDKLHPCLALYRYGKCEKASCKYDHELQKCKYGRDCTNFTGCMRIHTKGVERAAIPHLKYCKTKKCSECERYRAVVLIAGGTFDKEGIVTYPPPETANTSDKVDEEEESDTPVERSTTPVERSTTPVDLTTITDEEWAAVGTEASDSNWAADFDKPIDMNEILDWGTCDVEAEDVEAEDDGLLEERSAPEKEWTTVWRNPKHKKRFEECEKECEFGYE
uniref:C3H1-type domain-containing protein n=1 Tax=Abalone asfa-like virus TaxID=2839893 RepID=A0A5K7Y3K6_9VIRU|nr:hypothetical protein [Abalone asfa-like virus]